MEMYEYKINSVSERARFIRIRVNQQPAESSRPERRDPPELLDCVVRC